MRFILSLPFMSHPQNPDFLTQEAVATVAQAAEAAGFDAVSVTEHPIPEDDWLASGGHDALDPFVALSFAAAATSTIRLLTNLTVVPYRNPFLLAKSAASLDRLSGVRNNLNWQTKGFAVVVVNVFNLSVFCSVVLVFISCFLHCCGSNQNANA